MEEVMTAVDASARFRSRSSSSSIIPSNIPLISAFFAFALAQFFKLFTTWLKMSTMFLIQVLVGCLLDRGTSSALVLTCRYKEKRWDSRRLVTSGGMPSSHSAIVTALAVAIGLQEGLGGSAFAVALVLACVVMYDATGVRLHAGRQAELLNQIVSELPPEHPVSNVRPLRDSLGHTPLQVLAGSILGCIVAFLMRTSG